MQLVPLAATSCGSAACPTVFLDSEAPDEADVVVQGYVVPEPRSGELPSGEARVRIPRDLLRRAAQTLPADEG
jgi:hypothetical protein